MTNLLSNSTLTRGNSLRASLLQFSAGTALVLMSGQQAFAQNSSGSAIDNFEDEIVVTARKRTESLQDVPLSIAVTSGDALREGTVTNLESFTEDSPAITVVRTPLADALYIRGVGSGVNPGFQQSVGTFVDGVYVGRGAASRGAFFDVERIEVLRGPQPVYFGNSTIGGAFNITSKGPGAEFGVDFMTSYEFNADESITEIGVGGPITDSLGVRLAYMHQESDGWMTDTVRDQRVPAVNNDAVRLTVELDPNDSFDATLKIGYSDNTEDGGRLQLLDCPADTPPPAFGPTCNPGVFLVPGYEDELDYNLARGGVFPDGTVQDDTLDLNVFNSSLAMNYEFASGHTLSSVTGFLEFESDKFIDADVGPGAGAFISVDNIEDFSQFSQELRLTSPAGQRLSYMLGAYYDDSDLNVNQGTLFGAIPTPPELMGALDNGALVASQFDQGQESLALFGSVAYDLTDRLAVSVGARWSEVKIDVESDQAILDLNGSPPANPFTPIAVRFGPLQREGYSLNRSRKDTGFTPAFEIQYKATDNVMLYGSYKEAFKSGGFDANLALLSLAAPTPTDTNGGFEFEEEKAKSFEVGAKAQLLDNRLTLNAAAFTTDFKNLQTSTFDPVSTAFIVGNAGSATSKGFEVDGVFRVNDVLSLKGSATLLDSTYGEFAGAQCNDAENAAFVPSGPGDFCLTNLDGEVTPFAPDFSGNIGYALNIPVSDRFDLVSTGKYAYTTEFFGTQNPNPRQIQEAYGKIDARIGLSENTGAYELALYGKNLTNKVTFRQHFPLAGGGNFALVDRGREVGVQLRAKY